MTWLGLLSMALGLLCLFILWDVIFCGGQRCRELAARAIEVAPWLFRRRPPTRGASG